MQVGISTASLFLDLNTEDSALYLAQNKVPISEIFLTAYSEYNNDFARLIKSRIGDMKINSFHVLTTQYEPQLYSQNERALNDAYSALDMVLSSAKIFGAKNYTFHGYARIKKAPLKINYDVCGDFTQKIIERCAKYDISLAYENVHWCYYNYIGFFKELKKRCPALKGTLDIKQARQSDIFYGDFLSEMGSSLATVHISDIDKDGKMCLPGKGVFDFDDLFKRLVDVGFDGAVLTEAYRKDYDNREELLTSLEFVKEKASKYFKI